MEIGSHGTRTTGDGSLLVLSASAVETLLPMADAIDLMAEALEALARDEVHNPLRSVVRAPGTRGLLGLMPAFRGGARAGWGLKEVCVYPENSARGLDPHQGAVLLHDPGTGKLLAVVHGGAVTAIRTAAVSGIATRLLARHSAERLAILGAGVQARSHLEAMLLVRPIRSVRVWSRDPARARRLVEETRSRPGVRVETARSAEEAVGEADIIVTATAAAEPLLHRAWLPDGVHINAVGSSLPTTRELDGDTMAAASLFVDRRESTRHESGDFLLAVRDGAITPDHIRAEIGDLLVGRHPGREREDELTVFKSLGLAVEDLAAAQFVHRRAHETGLGAIVPF